MTQQPDKTQSPPAPAVDDEDPNDIPMDKKPETTEAEVNAEIEEDNERIQKGAP